MQLKVVASPYIPISFYLFRFLCVYECAVRFVDVDKIYRISMLVGSGYWMEQVPFKRITTWTRLCNKGFYELFTSPRNKDKGCGDHSYSSTFSSSFDNQLLALDSLECVPLFVETTSTPPSLPFFTISANVCVCVWVCSIFYVRSRFLYATKHRLYGSFYGIST